ncbi:MAG TPA: exonuclease SbcCD subunit D [Acidimicrobiia bacterium]
MKVLHTADWHVGKRLGRFDRTEEYRAAIAEVAGIADAHAADLVVHSGDLFDRGFPPVEVLRLAFEGLVALTAGGSRPVVVIAGNHDSPALFEALAPFMRGHGIHLVGEIKPPEENVLAIDTANGAAVVSCFPFLREGRAFHAFESPDGQYAKYADRLRRISGAYSAHARTLAGNSAVELLVAHFLVGGVAVHGHGARRGERELHMGEAYAASSQALPAGPQYVAMGHVHAPQPVPGALVPAHYAGSLLQMDFGEAGEDKRVLIVDVKPGVPAKVLSVPIQAGRPLLRPNGSWAEILATEGVYEAYLDLTVQTAGPDPGLADRVRDEFEWCVNVRADYPRIEASGTGGSGRSLPEHYADYYTSAEGSAPPDELIRLFSELLEEVENAPA